MLVNNINYLKEKYPTIREKLKNIEDNKDKKFSIEETRSGEKTLLYKDDGKEVYFHSKYNPIREAESLIEEYKEIKGQNIIFYGTGLGYHIDLLMTQNPDNDYYIFEPIPELLEAFLCFRDLTSRQYKNLKNISMGSQNMLEGIEALVKGNKKNTRIIELPIHKQVFKDSSKVFNDMFLTITRLKRINIATNLGFQKRWVINTIKNLKEILYTPNILIEKSGKFKNKPALLVAAGPSLNQEIENIRHIKENGLAYIISVGSAVNTLLHNDIHPHAATTYDPGGINQVVFKKIVEEGIKDIPMIFGSSVGYETLENYPGKKYHMITSQDPTSSYYLKSKTNKPIEKVQDASSIAVITVQLLSQLGFETILLVGQNLGYLGELTYAEGITYTGGKAKIGGEKNDLKIKDVYGNDIVTTSTYNSMRVQIEMYIKQFKDTKFINTTKGGANIEGAEFIELEKFIKSDLKESIVENDWLEGNSTEYDKEYLKGKLKSMDVSYDQALKITSNFINIVRNINKEIVGKNISRAESLYTKLDKEIRKMEKNDFYTHFLMPMNRVEYKMLAENVKSLNEIKNPYDKGEKIVMSYGGLISTLNDDLNLLGPIYAEMKKNIEEYMKES